MKKCEECCKKLGLLEGYRHPILGSSHLLCSPCFNQVSKSVDKWRKVVLPYVDYFNNVTSDSSLGLNWKNKLTDFFRYKKGLTKL